MIKGEEKLKILHLISSKAFLGAERVLTELVNCVDTEKFEVTVGVIQREPGITEIFRKAIKNKDVEVLTFECEKVFDYTCMKLIRKFVKNNDINIIHSHGYKSNFYALLIKCFGRNIALLSTNHLWKDISIKEKIYKYIDICVLHSFREIVGVSEEIYDQMKAVGLKKLVVIDNGIDVEHSDFINSTSNARTELGLSLTDVIVGCVGSLTKEKGQINLIKATLLFNEKNGEKFKVVFVGEGPERESLNDFVMQHNLSEQVLFTGYRNDVRKLFAAFNVFVLPSYAEGLPMVMLEAMAASLPVIVTDVGGISNVVVSGSNGILIRAGEPEGIVKKLELILEDTKLAQNLGKQARTTIEKDYSSRKMAERYQAIYMKCVG